MPEYLDPDDYVPFASTTVGETVRVNHCKEGKDKLYVTTNPDGIVAYCHHCGKRGFTRTALSEGTEAGSELSTPRVERSAIGASVHLPADSESRADYWRGDALTWAAQYLARSEITASPLCWSESNQGIVMPLFDASGLVGYQVRSFDAAETRKYITNKTKGAYARPFFHGRNKLAIVEDWISAYKIALSVPDYAALPLLGTNLTKEQMRTIISYPEITVALDNDKPDVRAAQAKIMRTLSCYTAVRSVHLQQDPKALTPAQLREVFN